MRCKRCHTKLTSGKKTCPVCGTLVRKPRGSVKLATTTGVRSNPIAELFGRVPKKLLVGIPAVIIFIAVCAVMITSCNCSCTCSGCSGCSEPVVYEQVVNTSPLGMEYYENSTLYYISGNSIIALNDAGEASVVAAGTGISAVSADSANVYYLRDGSLWVSPLEKPIVISDDDDTKYASHCLIPAGIPSGSDVGVMWIQGYTLGGGVIYYWGPAASGETRICSFDIASGGAANVLSGAISEIKYYRGRLYFFDVASGALQLCSVPAQGGEAELIGGAGSVYGYTLGDGCVYYTTVGGDGLPVLCKWSIENRSIISSWQISGISGLAANDSYIYYCKNTAEGGRLYRMTHAGEDSKTLFMHESAIELRSVCGKYFSVFVNVSPEGDRYAGASYWVLNTETRQQVY